MHVDRIEGLAHFEAERESWERLERADPFSTVFTSWRWLRAYQPVAKYRPYVLAVRDGADTLAYLPLARGGSLLDRELFLGGNPVADYAGMIAHPHRTDADCRCGDASSSQPCPNVQEALSEKAAAMDSQSFGLNAGKLLQVSCSGCQCSIKANLLQIKRRRRQRPVMLWIVPT